MDIPERQSSQPLNLFISSSPDDSKMKEHLLKHLSPLFSSGRALSEVWTRDSVSPGADLQVEVAEAIKHADLALLLISASYMADNFIIDKELPALLKRRETGSLMVIPVILRSCLWMDHPAIGGLQPLPKSGTPIAGHSGDAQDEQYLLVASAIADKFKQRQGAARNRDGASDSHLPPVPGRVRLVHEVMLATPLDEEASLPNLQDGLTAALQEMPLALGIAHAWRAARPFPLRAPWSSPQTDGKGGLLVSFKDGAGSRPSEYKLVFSKDRVLRLEEYIDYTKDQYGSPLIGTDVVAYRMASFIAFGLIALSTSLSPGDLTYPPTKFRWWLHELGGALCHDRNNMMIGRDGLAQASKEFNQISSKVHRYEPKMDFDNLLAQAMRDLLFSFSGLSPGEPGIVRPSQEMIAHITKPIWAALHRLDGLGLLGAEAL